MVGKVAIDALYILTFGIKAQVEISLLIITKRFYATNRQTEKDGKWNKNRAAIVTDGHLVSNGSPLTYIITYIIRHHNLSVRITSQFLYICVNFIYECWSLHFNVDSELQIFEKIFIVIFYLLSQCREEIAEYRYFFSYFVLMPDLG